MPNPNKCGGAGGCQGATVDMAFDWMIGKGGIVQEYQMGYTSYYGDNGNCTIEEPDMNFDESRVQKGLLGKTLRGPDPGGIKGAVANIDGYAKVSTPTHTHTPSLPPLLTHVHLAPHQRLPRPPQRHRQDRPRRRQRRRESLEGVRERHLRDRLRLREPRGEPRRDARRVRN